MYIASAHQFGARNSLSPAHGTPKPSQPDSTYSENLPSPRWHLQRQPSALEDGAEPRCAEPLLRLSAVPGAPTAPTAAAASFSPAAGMRRACGLWREVFAESFHAFAEAAAGTHRGKYLAARARRLQQALKDGAGALTERKFDALLSLALQVNRQCVEWEGTGRYLEAKAAVLERAVNDLAGKLPKARFKSLQTRAIEANYELSLSDDFSIEEKAGLVKKCIDIYMLAPEHLLAHETYRVQTRGTNFEARHRPNPLMRDIAYTAHCLYFSLVSGLDYRADDLLVAVQRQQDLPYDIDALSYMLGEHMYDLYGMFNDFDWDGKPHLFRNWTGNEDFRPHLAEAYSEPDGRKPPSQLFVSARTLAVTLTPSQFSGLAAGEWPERWQREYPTEYWYSNAIYATLAKGARQLRLEELMLHLPSGSLPAHDDREVVVHVIEQFL